MSLLDTASLIVTPNGYKEGKLYSVIPSDGSGDMSVTRATTATRVNSAGLVELVPYNLLSYSEQIDNGYWLKYQANITANNTTAPDGTMTADKITQAGGGAATFYVVSFPVGGIMTLSCYYKKGSNNVAVLELNRAGEGCVILYNLDTEVITPSGNYISTNIENLNNGWYRCSVTTNQTNGTAGYLAYGNIGNNGDTLYAWGAQLNEGSLKDYQKTETRLNIPRLDYSNGTCPSLLVEPQRTNLLWYSEQLDNSGYWSTYNSTISANSTTAPSGVSNADTLTSNASTGGDVYRLITLNGTYTLSIYLKSGNVSTARIGYSNGDTANFNLANGTYTITGGTSASIEDAGNGWWRCTFTTTISSGSFVAYGVDGVSSKFIYIWGAQLELGSYATSYIPTTSASVTRNADVISKTGISSLIGQTEGTLFLDFYYDGTTNNHMIINDPSFNSYIYFNSQNANQLWAQIQNINIQFSASASAGRHKLALAYKSGSSAFYLDGVQVGTSATTFTLSGSMSILDFTLTTPNNAINAAALWKTRLTNTQLAQLTTI
jgi:hypothetical protein